MMTFPTCPQIPADVTQGKKRGRKGEFQQYQGQEVTDNSHAQSGEGIARALASKKWLGTARPSYICTRTPSAEPVSRRGRRAGRYPPATPFAPLRPSDGGVSLSALQPPTLFFSL